MKYLIVLLAIAVFLVPQPTFAKSKLDLARDYIKIGENSQASSLISQAILSDPLNAQLHFEAGNLYLKLKDMFKATKALDNACKIDHSYCSKVAIYYKSFGFFNLNKVNIGGRSQLIINYFKKAIQLNPELRNVIYKKLFEDGENYINRSDTSNANKYFGALYSLNNSFGKKIADLYIQKSPEIKAEAALFLLTKLIYFDNSRKRDAGLMLAKLSKDDKYTKNEKASFKEFSWKFLDRDDLSAFFPSDFR